MVPNILMVDDDSLMHLLYRPHIERAGYRMLSAATGEEAIEISTRETLQAIVMDIRLPGLDGLSALREIRKHEHTKAIPVIVITSATDYDLCQREVKGIGRAIFMNKPFSPAQLLAEIKRLLGEGSAEVGRS